MEKSLWETRRYVLTPGINPSHTYLQIHTHTHTHTYTHPLLSAIYCVACRTANSSCRIRHLQARRHRGTLPSRRAHRHPRSRAISSPPPSRLRTTTRPVQAPSGHRHTPRPHHPYLRTPARRCRRATQPLPSLLLPSMARPQHRLRTSSSSSHTGDHQAAAV